MLVDELRRLALLIRNALNSPGADQHERVCHLNIELQRVVTDIRKLPGLSRFLLPLLLFSDLQRAASGGPVIIVGASEYSCDALIVFLDRNPVHIPSQIAQEEVREQSKKLHSLTVRADKDDVMRELVSFLCKLWDQIVSPIVDCLTSVSIFPACPMNVASLFLTTPYPGSASLTRVRSTAGEKASLALVNQAPVASADGGLAWYIGAQGDSGIPRNACVQACNHCSTPLYVSRRQVRRNRRFFASTRSRHRETSCA